MSLGVDFQGSEYTPWLVSDPEETLTYIGSEAADCPCCGSEPCCEQVCDVTEACATFEVLIVRDFDDFATILDTTAAVAMSIWDRRPPEYGTCLYRLFVPSDALPLATTELNENCALDTVYLTIDLSQHCYPYSAAPFIFYDVRVANSIFCSGGVCCFADNAILGPGDLSCGPLYYDTGVLTGTIYGPVPPFPGVQKTWTISIRVVITEGPCP